MVSVPGFLQVLQFKGKRIWYLLLWFPFLFRGSSVHRGVSEAERDRCAGAADGEGRGGVQRPGCPGCPSGRRLPFHLLKRGSFRLPGPRPNHGHTSAGSNCTQRSVNLRAKAFVLWQSKMQKQFISSGFKQNRGLTKGGAVNVIKLFN